MNSRDKGRNRTRCATTGKDGYRSRAKARKVLLHTNLARNGQKATYLCPFCGNYHLTSQTQRRRSGR